MRDRALAGLHGRYVFGDFCMRRGSSRRGSRPAARAASGGPRCSVASLSSFGEDAQGRVYAVSLDGPVYRIVPR